MIGGIQPSKIMPLIHDAIEGKGDDGLMQRFQFAVWPDEKNVWKWTDRAPDKKAVKKYRRVIREMHELPKPLDGQPGDHAIFSGRSATLHQLDGNAARKDSLLATLTLSYKVTCLRCRRPSQLWRYFLN